MRLKMVINEPVYYTPMRTGDALKLTEASYVFYLPGRKILFRCCLNSTKPRLDAEFSNGFYYSSYEELTLPTQLSERIEKVASLNLKFHDLCKKHEGEMEQVNQIGKTILKARENGVMEIEKVVNLNTLPSFFHAIKNDLEIEELQSLKYKIGLEFMLFIQSKGLDL